MEGTVRRRSDEVGIGEMNNKIPVEVDLDALTYDELIDLNHRIVERLKYWDSVNAFTKMMDYELGAKVSFESNAGRQTGTVVKFNKKTITVITDNGRRWNVSPHLLSLIEEKSRAVIVDVSEPEIIPRSAG
jgi:hypothetical protein